MRLLVSIVLFLTGPAAWACSLCSNPINRATLSEEMDLASVVVCGKLANPRLGSASQPGAGTTDLHIDEVLKDKGLLGATRQLTLSRYLPVADPKQPPRYLVFLEKYRDKLEPIQGIPIKSPAVIAYVKQAQAARTKGRIHALEFFGQHFDDADDAVAWDAFMEFAKSKDADVGEAARRLDPRGCGSCSIGLVSTPIVSGSSRFSSVAAARRPMPMFCSSMSKTSTRNVNGPLTASSRAISI